MCEDTGEEVVVAVEEEVGTNRAGGVMEEEVGMNKGVMAVVMEAEMVMGSIGYHSHCNLCQKHNMQIEIPHHHRHNYHRSHKKSNHLYKIEVLVAGVEVEVKVAVMVVEAMKAMVQVAHHK